MSIGRVSTYAIFQSTLKDSSGVEAELASLQNQLSSGKKSENFAGISSQTEQFIDLGNKMAKSSQYVTNNTLVSNKINDTSTALTQVINSATNLASLIQTRRTGTSGDNATFVLQVNQQWQAIVSALNSSSNGQYLFSGTATDTPAVDDQKFPTLDISDPYALNENYYQGSNDDITVRADDSTQFTYNVRANAKGFQQIFAGLANAAKGDSLNSDEMLGKAYDMIQSGLQSVIALQSTVNANKVALTNINANQSTLQIYWKSVQQDIGSTDLVSVSTQVAVDQGILQAAFQAFAKINSLSLSDYLK